MKVVLHAPTAGALRRARSNLKNLLKAEPGATALIIANADGVTEAIDHPDHDCDPKMRLCANSLAAKGLTAPEGVLTVRAAVVELARLQAEGWAYIRA